MLASWILVSGRSLHEELDLRQHVFHWQQHTKSSVICESRSPLLSSISLCIWAAVVSGRPMVWPGVDA
jgi:hypothetical protein